jgi:hypothetical protein
MHFYAYARDVPFHDYLIIGTETMRSFMLISLRFAVRCLSECAQN